MTKVHPKENMAMSLDEAGMADMTDALAEGDGMDLVRELARWAFQDLIEFGAA